jgi:iron-sulfur cluster assembly accessory protein
MTMGTEFEMQLTPAAKAFVRRMSRFAAGTESGFRLVVTPGGCSGFATTFDLISRPEASDSVWEFEGLRIFVGQESRRFLDGAIVDFVETLSHTGFVITTDGPAPSACAPLSKLVSIEPLVNSQAGQSGRASHGAGR